MKPIVIVLMVHAIGLIYQWIYTFLIIRSRNKKKEPEQISMKPKIARIVKGYIKDDGNLLETGKEWETGESIISDSKHNRDSN